MIDTELARQRRSSGYPVQWKRSQDGSITVEAALILPVVMAFVLLLVSLIRIASAEIALQSAVGETGKIIAGFWSPVRIVYQDAKERMMNTQAGVWTQDAISRIDSVRSGWTGTEEWIMQYEDLLPDSVVKLLKWEIGKREALEGEVSEKAGTVVHRLTDPLLCQTFEPVLKHYANPSLLQEDQLKVESVKLPSLESGDSPYVEIVASYSMDLHVPFLKIPIRLEKKSFERAWVGDE